MTSNFSNTSNVKKTPISKKAKKPKQDSTKKMPASMIAGVFAGILLGEHNRFVCNDLEQYLDHIKKTDGNVAMKTRYGNELRVSYSATVNMFTTPDAKLGSVIRASDPALTQEEAEGNNLFSQIALKKSPPPPLHNTPPHSSLCFEYHRINPPPPPDSVSHSVPFASTPTPSSSDTSSRR
jgi:hypothetical protein